MLRARRGAFAFIAVFARGNTTTPPRTLHRGRGLQRGQALGHWERGRVSGGVAGARTAIRGKLVRVELFHAAPVFKRHQAGVHRLARAHVNAGPLFLQKRAQPRHGLGDEQLKHPFRGHFYAPRLPSSQRGQRVRLLLRAGGVPRDLQAPPQPRIPVLKRDRGKDANVHRADHLHLHVLQQARDHALLEPRKGALHVLKKAAGREYAIGKPRSLQVLLHLPFGIKRFHGRAIHLAVARARNRG